MMSLADGTLTVSDKFVGKGDASVEKALTVTGTFIGKGNATLGSNVTVAGGSETQKTTGGNTLDVQRVTRTDPERHRTGLALYVTATSDPADKLVEFRDSNGSQGIGFGYNTIYATGSNPNQPLRLKARGNDNVEIVRNDQNLAVASGVEALRMLRGVVRANGTSAAGAGFKPQRKDTGIYDITFDKAFSSLPGVSVTQIYQHGGADPLSGFCWKPRRYKRQRNSCIPRQLDDARCDRR